MREMTTDFKNAALASVVYPAFLTEADFDSGSIGLWNGIGTLSVGGVDYMGSGTLLQIDPAQETGEIEAGNATFRMSGIQESDISIALTEDYQGRPCRMLMGLFTAAGTLIADPIRLFTGRMDVMNFRDDPADPSITMTAENDLIRLNRSKPRRRTHEDQQIDHPGDMFFSHVNAMQHKDILWG